jgi:hypothetical protein
MNQGGDSLYECIALLVPVAITIKPSTNSAPTIIRIRLSLKKRSKPVKIAPCLKDKIYGSNGNPASHIAWRTNELVIP